MPVRDSSIEAYHQLKQEGKISEKRSVAFNALIEYAEAEDTDRWPTALELYEWAQANLDNEEFTFSRCGNFKPRITELKPGSDATDIELVEELEEKRLQDSETTEQKAYPVKILSYQSTLSSEEGEAAELKETGSESSPVTGSDRPGRDIEIPYSVNGGSEVRMANPEEAIAQTDDLEGVEEMLEQKDLLEEYQDEIDAVRSEESKSGGEDSAEEDSSDSDEESGELVKTEMGYVFDPDDDYKVKKEDDLVSDDAEDSVDSGDVTNEDDVDENNSGDDEQQVLMKDGEVVV